MTTTFEISLYPLQEEYKKTIISFIKKLNAYKELSIHTTAMSTYITGPFKIVMNILAKELGEVYEEIPDSATIIKIIPKDLGVEEGFLRFD